ncbi:unnamed protein product [Notodromas monacha]|uniref:Peptidase S54 rhomboid domain-containing protein n=1 Tax=Notodromas monacha TaxID=399045 RepID=A0A7R9BT10_9CRUS|nr:unnamed protein product [Notodromas monacha]CAG0921204.1 unnamed protein product [Notodromas monacha]
MLAVFVYYSVTDDDQSETLSDDEPVPMDSVFIYRPDKRGQVWRFLLYMVLHTGWIHLLFNSVVQILVGLPLEMVHGSLRVCAVYLSGVLAGSIATSIFDPDVYLVGASGGIYALLASHLANVVLNFSSMEHGIVRIVGIVVIGSIATSIFDPDVYLVGASGGIYALLASHLANVVLNFSSMEHGIVRIVGIVVIAATDIGFAVYHRYFSLSQAAVPVSYAAHVGGAAAGFFIGLLVLRCFEKNKCQVLLRYLAFGALCTWIVFVFVFYILGV